LARPSSISKGGYRGSMSVSKRYDAFQREAVSNILADFREEANGRFLLVIPTGGGKTTTAVKAVDAIYDAGLLDADDRVAWVVHRDELRRQASDNFENYSEARTPALSSRIDVLMLSQVKQYLADHPTLKFAVIDEAHHVAAQSYKPLFDRPNLGILGLTATPSRHDGQPLQFTRESYSIGFPELVNIGVLLRPNVIRIEGGTYDITDIGDDSEMLEALNNDERNGRILFALRENSPKITKAIVYVGTRQHARDLYQLFKSSSLTETYKSISLILGDERRRYLSDTGVEIAGESRADFIAAQKSSDSSILLNVDVLSEGYDDPTVNAIVMARPTNSKLVYMQALGRAVRIDPNNAGKEAYVLEVTDNLPNIKYRIDNRWLYSDISDILEPNVVDEFYASPDDLLKLIPKVFDAYGVPGAYRTVPEFTTRDRITMLLFRVYVGEDKFEHVPVLITNNTRQAAAGFFDFLASRMKQLKGLAIEQAFRPVLLQVNRFPVLEDENVRSYVFQAMENAWELVSSDPRTISDGIEAGRPWISFVSFRLQMTTEGLGDDLILFTNDMLNKEPILTTLRSGSVGHGFVLVKFPLPLRGSWGVFLTELEFATLRKTIEQLEIDADQLDGIAQWQSTVAVLGTATVPVEQRHLQSLPTIVRERLDYFRPLDQCITGSAR